jgi:hypothetical protein
MRWHIKTREIPEDKDGCTWQAYLVDDPRGPKGRGTTSREAIADLIEYIQSDEEPTP